MFRQPCLIDDFLIEELEKLKVKTKDACSVIKAENTDEEYKKSLEKAYEVLSDIKEKHPENSMLKIGLDFSISVVLEEIYKANK